MPIYEYRCEACEACFEKLVFGEEKDSVRCPQCGDSRVHRQMSCVSDAGRSASDKCASGASGFS